HPKSPGLSQRAQNEQFCSGCDIRQPHGQEGYKESLISQRRVTQHGFARKPKRRLQRGYLLFNPSAHGLLDWEGSSGAIHLLRRPPAKGGSRDGFRLLRLNNETITVSGRPVFCTSPPPTSIIQGEVSLHSWARFRQEH